MLKFDDVTYKLMNYIKESGYNSYIVGGAIRDSLLNIKYKDIDIVIDCDTNQIIELFKDYKLVKYNKEKSYGLLYSNNFYDISLFHGNNLIEDLKSRDFTINAIALDINNNFIDPLNGINDLNDKIIRTCDKPSVTLDSPVRFLRAIRFSSTLNFSIESNLDEYIINNSSIFNGYSKAKLRTEFNKILISNNPSFYITKYRNIFFKLVTDLELCYGLDQCNPYHNLDVYTHIMRVLDNTKPELITRISALYHDIGKPKTFTKDEMGIGHFYNHYTVSSEIIESDMKEFGYSNLEIKKAKKIVLYHDYQFDGTLDNIINFLNKFGHLDLDIFFDLKKADIIGQNPNKIERLNFIDKVYNNTLEIINNTKDSK